MGGGGHAEARCADTQSGGYQDYSRSVLVGKTAHECYQNGAN